MPDDANSQPGPDPLYTAEPEDASPNPEDLIAPLTILRGRKFRNYTIALGALAAGVFLALVFRYPASEFQAMARIVGLGFIVFGALLAILTRSRAIRAEESIRQRLKHTRPSTLDDITRQALRAQSQPHHDESSPTEPDD